MVHYGCISHACFPFWAAVDVAAAGIPDAREDHAIVMVRFAREILRNFARTTKDLEVMLGPDTGDLSLRIGIHSGPVTAVSSKDML